jgi:hypothetical protein
MKKIIMTTESGSTYVLRYYPSSDTWTLDGDAKRTEDTKGMIEGREFKVLAFRPCEPHPGNRLLVEYVPDDLKPGTDVRFKATSPLVRVVTMEMKGAWA